MKLTRMLACLVLSAILLLLTGCNPAATDITVACDTQALINAITTANVSPSTTTTIHLEAGCVYELTTSVTMDTESTPAGVGLPEIISPIIIDGQNATIRRSAASGTPEFRFFLVHSDSSLTINNLTLTGGNVRESQGYGGAVLNNGIVAINTCEIFDNHADKGGGVFNRATFYSESSLYYNNHAHDSGGAIFNSGNVYSTANHINHTGEITIRDSQFYDNYASWGGAIDNAGGLAAVEDSIFHNNRAWREQGNIGVEGGAILNTSVRDVFDNLAIGEMTIRNSDFYKNTGGVGGAINNQIHSRINIYDSTFYNNYAQSGGALYNHAEMTLIRSVLYDNEADFNGGAITFQDNNDSPGLSITNTTLSGNQVFSPSVTYSGSAIYHVIGSLKMDYVTVTDNINAPAYSKNGGGAIIENSIIANNPDGDCSGSTISTLDVLGSANIDSDGSCPGFTITTDPKLDPLADNGGDTLTHALQVESPAFGAAAGYCPAEDQRNEYRPYGSRCDLGAYESHDYLEPMVIVITELPGILTEVPEEPHKEPNWWWKFEGFVCSESGLTEFYLSTDAGPELFSMTINEMPVKCYQQSYDEQRYWCHVEQVMLEWEIPTEILFCAEDVCESIRRTTLSQELCEGETPPAEPEQQACSTFTTEEACSAAPGCMWFSDPAAAGSSWECVTEE
ncbi:MAG: hypothetical protein JXA25_00485 [Anaerolineales bacterium]|nr:hypothetical protein [Anaerolineales bacterium]